MNTSVVSRICCIVCLLQLVIVCSVAMGQQPAEPQFDPNTAPLAEIDTYYAGVGNETRALLIKSNTTFMAAGLFIPDEAFDHLTPEQLDAAREEWLATVNGPAGRQQGRAIEALGAIHCEDAVPALLELATNRRIIDNRTRWLATRALGRIGGEDVVLPLIYLVDYFNSNTKYWAQASLYRLTGEWHGEDREAWGAWWNAAGGEPPYVAEKRYATLEEAEAIYNRGRKRPWGPEQATGPPDTMRAVDARTAWATQAENAGIEWLKLDYEQAIEVAEVRVWESYNPGAVCKVSAILDDGTELILWEGQDPTREAPDALVVFVDGDVTTKSVTVYLDTSLVDNWNEIDAVELVGRDGTRHWASSASASSFYGERPPE